MMAYTGRLCPKVVLFSGFRYKKGEGNITFRTIKRANDALYACEQIEDCDLFTF